MAAQTPPPSGIIEPVELRSALEERYLAYALSTIMHRALPDVRDGMKPVHRRLLFAMRQLKLDPGEAFKKSARVVGDVIGKYHPHGDQSVYDALVRLAQDFAVRYPLVEGQGNFGTLDGDGAAAMRYTEARLTDVAVRLLDGIDEDAVDFRETYDGSESEPIVLPAAFPNLLANGANGIAVGMATSIPPHNVAELADAALTLVDNPNATLEDLLMHVRGPDFPTGGVLVEDPGALREAYSTGRGGLRLRARWRVEDQGRGAWVVVITEIPYQVQKSRLIERIAELIETKKIPLVADVRDESAEDVRLIIEPRTRTVDPAIMMESLFKLSDLEVRVSFNMNVLIGGVIPEVIGLKAALQHWLDHRKEVIVRRARFRLAKVVARLEVLAGFLIVYLDLDTVIRIIREEDEPKVELMKVFSLTDVQAEAILNMRLRSLRKLEEMEIRREFDKLTAEKGKLDALLGSTAAQWAAVGTELIDLKKTYGPETALGKRRTTFAEATAIEAGEILEAMVEREPVTVIISELGWIRTLKGHGVDTSTLTFKQGDQLRWSFPAQTTDKLLVLSTSGRIYTIGCDKLPGGRGHGEAIRLMVDMDQASDVADIAVHRPGAKLLVASAGGYGFIVPEAECLASTRKGKQVLTIADKDKAARMVPAEGDHVAVIGDNRKLVVFPLTQLAEMNRGKGVRLQRYRDGSLSDLRVFVGSDGLSWTDTHGRVHRRSLEELKEWVADRGTPGRQPPTGFPHTNRFG